jgi:ribosomal-protein-serine acetyltransferase
VARSIELPRIEGELVRLRPAEPRDVPIWAQAFVDDPELGPAWGLEEDPGEAELRERVESATDGPEQGRWAELVVADRQSDALIGGVILHSFDWQHEHAEVGFWLSRAHRGRGAATEAVSLMVDWAFNALDLHRVEMITLPALPSIDRVLALAARLGFREEGLMRERNFERGRRYDTLMLGVLRDEWVGVDFAADGPPLSR